MATGSRTDPLTGYHFYLELDGIAEAQRVGREQVRLKPGYRLEWGGQFQYLERAKARLRIVVPVTIVLIFVLLYMNFRSVTRSLIVLLSVPFGVIGAIVYLYLLQYHLSVAVWVGIIALAGVAAEFGIIMLLYLRHAWERKLAVNPHASEAELEAAIREGAVQRVRPKAMTVAVILAGLLPILLGGGAGSEVMQRIAAPMVGGMLSAPLLSMLVIPAAYALLQRRRLVRGLANPAGS